MVEAISQLASRVNSGLRRAGLPSEEVARVARPFQGGPANPKSIAALNRGVASVDAEPGSDDAALLGLFRGPNRVRLASQGKPRDRHRDGAPRSCYDAPLLGAHTC
jgi:hypothetical protein